MSFGVVIIGLGQIGMGYDLELPADLYVMTHARAFQNDPDFTLLGGVDVNADRRSLFEHEYGCKAFADVGTALKLLMPDIVVISVPTEFHLDAVKSVFNACRPRIILCEKPLAYKLSDAEKIDSLCKEHQCKLFVNYLRRADPGVLEVKARISRGAIACPIKGVAWYSKGLFNNGSHFVDLLHYWLGDIQEFQVIDSGRLLENGDFEPDVRISFKNGSVYFLAGKEECFSLSGIELISPSGRFTYEDGGGLISWQSTMASNTHSGYTILSSKGELINSDLNRAQWHIVHELANYLDGKDANICSGYEALKVVRWLNAIRDRL